MIFELLTKKIDLFGVEAFFLLPWLKEHIIGILFCFFILFIFIVKIIANYVSLPPDDESRDRYLPFLGILGIGYIVFFFYFIYLIFFHISPIIGSPEGNKKDFFHTKEQATQYIAHQLRADGRLEESLTVVPYQTLSAAEAKALEDSKNVFVLTALVNTFQSGTDDVPKDKEKAVFFVKKLIEISVDNNRTKSRPVKLMDDYVKYLSKIEIEVYLQRIDKNCQNAEDIYTSSKAIRENGEEWAEAFTREHCIPVYNEYHSDKIINPHGSKNAATLTGG